MRAEERKECNPDDDDDYGLDDYIEEDEARPTSHSPRSLGLGSGQLMLEHSDNGGTPPRMKPTVEL